MLQNDFFTISSINLEGDSYKARLELNAKHKIFEGHFPGQPVVPGACLMQMVKEVTETILGSELLLIKADHLKFLAVIDPNKKGVLEMQLTIDRKEDDSLYVSASLSENASVCFKFSGLFMLQ